VVASFSIEAEPVYHRRGRASNGTQKRK